MFYLEKNQIFAVPITHYNMEMALQVRLAIEEIKPDCIAVEFAENMQLQLLNAASRLPDTSVVIAHQLQGDSLYYMCEPCDASFEALRSALELKIPSFCIDLDVADYPETKDFLPDAYSITRIGLKNYYEAYKNIALKKETAKKTLDHMREMFMAKKLKELQFSYERILFVCGMAHVENVLKLTEQNAFPIYEHCTRNSIELRALTEKSNREVMAEFGYLSSKYEDARIQKFKNNLPDRQKIIYQLFKDASVEYIKNTGNAFPGYHFRNIMKFLRNYALIYDRLMPDLFQIITAAKLNVDSNYAYEVWSLATNYEHRKNVDSLNESDLSIEDIWGKAKIIRFNMKQKSRKNSFFERQAKSKSSYRFKPPGMFSICSYPKEDLVIERFGNFLKKRGSELLREESAKTLKFTTSIEDGIDTRETIRHWHEKKIYVKVKGKPQGEVGSVVVIFDEDAKETDLSDDKYLEKFPWTTSWLGEHAQESDMAFYSTRLGGNVIGPGICRCEYGGFMMSYPPRRLRDIWSDPDYEECQTKAETLLMAAIDYAVKPLIIYVAAKPPRSIIKSFAKRFGKKIVYLPLGGFSSVTMNKLRIFHVLDGQDKRAIADDYIF